MKPTHLITLMTALSIGSAAAQATVSRPDNLTNAGVTITNTANASFQDPSNAASTLTASSNTVSTTVLPKYGFNITYPAGGDADSTDTTSGAPATHQRTNVVPGTRLVYTYAAVNNGNAQQVITLTSSSTSGVSNVLYFTSNPDADNDGAVSDTELSAATAVTSITLPVQGDDPSTATEETSTGVVPFYMVYTATGNAGAVVGATPIGTGQAWNGTENVSTTEQKDAAAPTYDDLWWQYNSATIITPNLDNAPKQSVTTTVTPPPTGSTPVTGYLSGTTPIAVSGDEQSAYPKSDSDSNPDSVQFTNSISNGSSVADTVSLSIIPRAVTGFSQTVSGSGTTYTITQTNPDGSITTATVTLSTASVTVAANGSQTYTVTVTYADPDALNPYPIYIAIGADSGNDSDTNSNDTTFDTIYPAAMLFNDGTTSTSTNEDVTKPGTAGNDVVFPMTVLNQGEYGDTYNLSGYTVVTLLDGSRQIVPIVYSGTGVSSSDTRTVQVDLNGDGDTTDAGESLSIPVYTTGAVNANSTLDVNATVALPSNVRSNNGTDYLLSQTATAVYSGISLQDTNDKITVALVGGLGMAKFTQTAAAYAASSEYVLSGTVTSGTSTDPRAVANPANYSANSTSYVPGVEYSYKILAKNTYNVRIEKFFLSDTLNSNLTFVSVLGTISGNTIVDLVGSPDTSGTSVIYSTDGTTWSAVAPLTGTTLYVAVDDPSLAGLQPGSLDPNATLDMTITVKIK